MRKITEHELRLVQETLDWIKPLVELEMCYSEGQNILMIGDNYIIKGFVQKAKEVEKDMFSLIYGSTHPGDKFFDLDRWEEEDIARATSVEYLLPIFVSNITARLMEERIFRKVRFDSPVIQGYK
jgi:hypothetical protein